MEALLFTTDGQIDRIPVNGHVEFFKDCALALVQMPSTNVYRVQIVDTEYGRVCWDTYLERIEAKHGTLAFAGVDA